MSGKRVNAREYQKLLNKLFLQITGLLVGAVVLVLGVRVAFRGQFANGIVLSLIHISEPTRRS